MPLAEHGGPTMMARIGVMRKKAPAGELAGACPRVEAGTSAAYSIQGSRVMVTGIGPPNQRSTEPSLRPSKWRLWLKATAAT